MADSPDFAISNEVEDAIILFTIVKRGVVKKEGEGEALVGLGCCWEVF
jgi:hypothetical protein